MSQNNVIPRNVSLYPEDYAIVHQFAKDRGQTFSSGLRLIIREWAELKTQITQELNSPTRLQP